MSASRGGSGGGLQAIPAGSRKMVQSLKEIVGCSEAEIYAALKECNMDPNEAVNRLLSQDPFHEVKSKREKKKEGKDFTESRPRGANNNSSRGSKVGADRYGGRGSSSYISSDSVPSHGKASYKKENESLPHSGSLSGNVRSRGSTGFSNGPSAETRSSILDLADTRPSDGIQPTSGYQSAWMGAPGQLSMADIVKMGRPHNKDNTCNHNVQVSSISVSDRNVGFLEDHVAIAPESEISSVHHMPTNDEWPTDEKPTAKLIAVSGYAMQSEQNMEPSGVRSDSFSDDSEEEEGQDTEDERFETFGTNDLGSDSISGRKIPMDNSGGVSLFENDLYKNMGSHRHQAPEYHSGDAVEEVGASVLSTRNLQQQSVEEEYSDLPSSESVPSVVIPDHLQVQNADCSYLSFGSFRPGMSTTYSSASTSIPVKPDLEEPHSEADTSPVEHPDTRGPEYFVDGSQRNASDGGLLHRASASAGNYDNNASEPKELQSENAKVPHGNEYPFPSSNYSFDDALHSNATFSQTITQMQNLTPFSNVMQQQQPYTNSIPSTLLPTNLPPSGESNLQYSPFPVAQSPSAKYGNSVSSVGASTISISEALMTAGSSSTPAPHTLTATNAATGPPIPQHLSVHPYSQHTLPLGPFANMLGYPFLPQNYAYMPSAFQQTFAGNSAYHQALASLLPQYKSNVPSSSLSQSAAITSGYGAAFGNTSTVPGNFAMNQPNTPPPGSSLNYDDVLSTQNKDNSHLLSLQQSENPAMWLQGPNSRTMSAVPASGYYNYPGQNQSSSGLRQGQPPSQNYGALGYPNLFHSQTTGISLDHQQNPRDGLLGPAVSHGQPKQSQMWQNGY